MEFPIERLFLAHLPWDIVGELERRLKKKMLFRADIKDFPLYLVNRTAEFLGKVSFWPNSS